MSIIKLTIRWSKSPSTQRWSARMNRRVYNFIDSLECNEALRYTMSSTMYTRYIHKYVRFFYNLTKNKSEGHVFQAPSHINTHKHGIYHKSNDIDNTTIHHITAIVQRAKSFIFQKIVVISH